MPDGGMSTTPVIERACEWCRIPYRYWQAIRCIETADDFVFCSQTCLEHYEDATGREQEIVSELPFPWNRGLVDV